MDLGDWVPYSPPKYVAVVLDKYDAPKYQNVFRDLGGVDSRVFLDDTLTNNQRGLIKDIFYTMLDFIGILGYQAISEAHYMGAAVYKSIEFDQEGKDVGKYKVVISANQDPPRAEFNNRNARLCAEINMNQTSREKFGDNGPVLALMSRLANRKDHMLLNKTTPCPVCAQEFLPELNNAGGNFAAIWISISF